MTRFNDIEHQRKQKVMDRLRSAEKKAKRSRPLFTLSFFGKEKLNA